MGNLEDVLTIHFPWLPVRVRPLAIDQLFVRLARLDQTPPAGDKAVLRGEDHHDTSREDCDHFEEPQIRHHRRGLRIESR
jgi:hypothetical protein